MAKEAALAHVLKHTKMAVLLATASKKEKSTTLYCIFAHLSSIISKCGQSPSTKGAVERFTANTWHHVITTSWLHRRCFVLSYEPALVLGIWNGVFLRGSPKARPPRKRGKVPSAPERIRRLHRGWKPGERQSWVWGGTEKSPGCKGVLIEFRHHIVVGQEVGLAAG